ncbi:MAG TPA: hypothetical protein ENI17_12740 [Pseudomonas xinjiangensis]|uniref:DNA recombination protein RmuC n=2 Tax=root TaxID=1 RepID=A0A7V1FT48_9GAMM|nr:hypothetical protein [Halopseudomonas xinjiangensis]HEC48479.1 hypothetical protein [Halopseudomonas xinjiangensis]
MDIIIGALLGAVVMAGLGYLLVRQRVSSADNRAIDNEAKFRALDRQLHENEARFLQLKNTMDLENHENMKAQREKYLNEGIETGKSISAKDHQIEVTNLRAEFRQQLSEERQKAEDNGKRLARAEFESQSKAFGVSIKPYVLIEKSNGLLWNDSKAQVGYLYQLLVNGIPAFQPHIVIEKTEIDRQANQQNIDKLVELATRFADGAVRTYLGGSSGAMLEIGEPIVQEVKKK